MQVLYTKRNRSRICSQRNYELTVRDLKVCPQQEFQRKTLTFAPTQLTDVPVVDLIKSIGERAFTKDRTSVDTL